MATWMTLLATLPSGCATVPAPDSRHQSSLGRVAIVAAARDPVIQLKGFPQSKGAGVAAGAGGTFLSCMSGLGSGGCSGPYCGAAIVLFIGACGVAGIVGGVAGGVEAPHAAEVAGARHTIDTALDTSTIQESLSGQVISNALTNGVSLTAIAPDNARAAARSHDYRPLAAEADTIVEVALTDVHLDGAGLNSPLQLTMQAHVRLVQAADNSEKFAADYAYDGASHSFAEWTKNKAERLIHALQEGYETLGTHISDSTFLLYPLPDRKPRTPCTLCVYFGLAALDPITRGVAGNETAFDFITGPNWSPVKSVRPTLRWDHFPRDRDLKAAPGEMARVKNVRYDLIIARERYLKPAEVVYRRDGLPEPQHTLDAPLLRNSRYFWTVRARFELDGRLRVTEWGATSYQAFGKQTALSPWSYRFKTP